MEWKDGFLLNNCNSINIIENKWNVILPKKFIEIISNYNKSYTEFSVFDTDRNQRMFSGFLNFDIDSKYDVLEVYKDIKDRLPQKVYPFGYDPFGNFICFDYRKNEIIPAIIFWNHEYFVKNGEESYGTELVSDTFENFIDKLYKIDQEPIVMNKEEEDFWNNLIESRKREEDEGQV